MVTITEDNPYGRQPSASQSKNMWNRNMGYVFYYQMVQITAGKLRISTGSWHTTTQIACTNPPDQKMLIQNNVTTAQASVLGSW